MNSSTDLLSEALGIRVYRPVLRALSTSIVADLNKGQKLWGGENPHENFMPSALPPIKCLAARVFIVLRALQYQGRGNTSYSYQSGGFVTRLVKCLTDPAPLPSRAIQPSKSRGFSLSSLHAHRWATNLSDNTDLQCSGRAQWIVTFLKLKELD